MKRLEREGARVTVVSLHKGRIRGMNLLVPGRKVRVDATLRDVKAADFDALLLPGGFMNPDFLRQSALALDFVKDADRGLAQYTTGRTDGLHHPQTHRLVQARVGEPGNLP